MLLSTRVIFFVLPLDRRHCCLLAHFLRVEGLYIVAGKDKLERDLKSAKIFQRDEEFPSKYKDMKIYKTYELLTENDDHLCLIACLFFVLSFCYSVLTRLCLCLPLSEVLSMPLRLPLSSFLFT